MARTVAETVPQNSPEIGASWSTPRWPCKRPSAKLDTGQERAAREIATIYQAVVAALMPRIARLGVGKGPGRGSLEGRMPEDIAICHQ